MNLLKSTAAVVIGTLCWNSTYAAIAPLAPANEPVTIDAEAILNTQSNLRGEITQSLNDQKVVNELGKMGITKSEVQMRLAAMSDQELKQVAEGVQRKAGGDVVVVSLTTILLIAIIVILIVK